MLASILSFRDPMFKPDSIVHIFYLVVSEFLLGQACILRTNLYFSFALPSSPSCLLYLYLAVIPSFFFLISRYFSSIVLIFRVLFILISTICPVLVGSVSPRYRKYSRGLC